MSIGATTKNVTLPDGGKVLTLSKLTQGGKDEFAAWLKDRMDKETMDRGESLRGRAATKWEEVERLKDIEEDRATPGPKSIEAGLARQKLAKQARILEMESRALMKEFMADCAAGMYEFHGTACDQALATKFGFYEIAWIMLKAKHPELKTVQDLIELVCYETTPNNYEALQDAVLRLMGLVRDDEKNAPGASGAASSATSGQESTTQASATTTQTPSSPTEEDIAAAASPASA